VPSPQLAIGQSFAGQLAYPCKFLSKSFVKELMLFLQIVFYLRISTKRSVGIRTQTGDTMIFGHERYVYGGFWWFEE
jgi:hypothetical protein